MASRAFKTAAERYIFDYDREVAAFYGDHPALRKKLYFLDAGASAVYRGDTGDEDEAAALLGQNAHLGGVVAETRKTGIGGAVRYAAEGYDCVILKTPRGRAGVNPLGHAAPDGAVDAFSFDHEIGHLVCPGGYAEATELMKECIADSYATLRHIQRFGADSAPIRNLPAMRAVEMVFGGECGHFTLPVVEKILADAKTMDFEKLSPQETVALAVTYAAANAEKPMLVSFMADAFYALRLTVKGLSDGDFTPVRALGDFLLQTRMPEQYKWGAAIFNAVLDGNIGIEGKRLPKPEGAAWEKLRKAIAVRADSFGKPPPSGSGLIIVPKL